jgi:DNA-binding transcriptional MerR regulator
VTTTGEAAKRLAVTAPTVRAWLEKGILVGTKEPRGSRPRWDVDSQSLDLLVAQRLQGTQDRHARGSRFEKIERELSDIRRTLGRLLLDDYRSGTETGEETNDDLRAHLVNLEEALVRSRAVADLQREADTERALVIDHLLTAIASGERADAITRRALAEQQEATAAFTRLGHVGDIS